MLSDLASEVLKKTENHSPKFVLEKTVMEKSCFLTVEWPIQRFSIRIHNNKPIVVKSLLEATSIFCTALCNTGLQSTFVKVVHKQSLRTWSSVGLLYRSSDSLLDFESVCNWIKRYVLRKHHIPPSLGPHSDEDFSSQPASPNTRLTNYPIDPLHLACTNSFVLHPLHICELLDFSFPHVYVLPASSNNSFVQNEMVSVQ